MRTLGRTLIKDIGSRVGRWVCGFITVGWVCVPEKIVSGWEAMGGMGGGAYICRSNKRFKFFRTGVGGISWPSWRTAPLASEPHM